jgi:hypothetical protein
VGDQSPIDPAEAELLTHVYDGTDRNDRILYQLARGDWARFLQLKLQFVEVLRAAGPDNVGRVSGDPVPGSRRKYAEMCAFCQGETDGIDNEWIEVDAVLGISWPDQCRILANPRRDEKSRKQFLMLMRMDDDDRVEFEQAARAGASIRALAERWQLGFHLVRRIVLMFNGVHSRDL